MKTIRQYLGLLIAGILLFFLIKPFVQTHTQLKDVTFEIHWGWLVCSLGTILFYWSAYLYPFAILLSGISQKQVSFRSAWTLFHLANITRYLPGRIWGFVRLLSLSQRFGLSKTTVGSGLTLHVSIDTALGGLIATSVFFSKQTRETAQRVLEKISGYPLLIILISAGIIAGGLFLFPVLSSHAYQFLKTFRHSGTRLLQKPFRKRWLNILVSHILLWCCQGLAFFFFLRSFVPMVWTDIGSITACYAFAWIVGFLIFLTPGGLGIREGLLGLLLSSYLPISEATLVALLCRVWILSAEITLAGIAFSFNQRSL